MAACPVHTRAHGYIFLIAQRRFKEALDLVRRDNPLPGISGRVCTHPCEETCERKRIDEPLAIAQLKRFIADYERKNSPQLPPPARKSKAEKIAIVGSGPAGLTAAYHLALKGYGITIFESLQVLGGMLVVGIPPNRLPRDVVEYEVNRIKALGVEMRTGIIVGKDISFEDLFTQGYKATFIAIGAHKGLKLGVIGEDEYKGAIDCITFLRNVNLGDRNKPGDKVCIIGGGNSAIDASRTAIRLGCSKVRIVYRRSRDEMLATLKEVDAAEEEGVKILYRASPLRILGKNGQVTGMECIKNRLGEPDSSGRRSPIPIEGSNFTLDADIIISAINQQPDLSFLPNNHGFNISKWNSFVVEPVTLETNRPGIFAGGDAVTGPATVIEAIASGKRAANMIDQYINGLDMKDKERNFVPTVRLTEKEINKVEKMTRQKIAVLPVAARCANFDEVELGFDEESAVTEAKRCLRCWTHSAIYASSPSLRNG